MVRPAERGWTALNEKKRRDGTSPWTGPTIQEDESGEDQEAEDKLDRDWDDDSVSSSSSSSSISSSGLRTPPESDDGSDTSHDKSKKPLAYGHCPVCEQPWANPTALPTGYVGCYLCLYRFVERQGVCPVTGCDLGGIGGVESLRKVLV